MMQRMMTMLRQPGPKKENKRKREQKGERETERERRMNEKKAVQGKKKGNEREREIHERQRGKKGRERESTPDLSFCSFCSWALLCRASASFRSSSLLRARSRGHLLLLIGETRCSNLR